MKLLVTGGTGFIGRALCRVLVERGHEPVVITRAPSAPPAQERVEWLSWEGAEWQRRLAGTDGLINLAGESIAATRWSPARKALIRGSRIQTTRALVNAMAVQERRPSVLVSASAIGYYGPRGDETLAESAEPGGGFLAATCQAWEAEAQRAERLGVRVVRLRIGLVLAPDGGALAKMARPFRAFLGGPLGSGRQWVSWIHREDVLGVIEWALTHPTVRGAVNATAPQPVPMRAFCRELGRVLHRPSWAPVPAIALRLLVGEMAELLLTGQRVLPTVAVEQGYAFRYPGLQDALAACFPQRQRQR